MNGIVSKITEQLVNSMLRKKEAVIRSLLPGGSGIAGFKGRLGMFSTPDGNETYTLDGKPIIKFYPLEFGRETSDGNGETKIVGTLHYRVLNAGEGARS